MFNLTVKYLAAIVIFLSPISALATRYDGACIVAPIVDQRDAKKVVRVSTEYELQQAVNKAERGTVILIAPGEYWLTRTLTITTDNVTIRGNSHRCDDVVLHGRGMENAEGKRKVPHGFWISASDTRIQNLTIKDVYYHAVSIDRHSHAPVIYNVRMIDAGEQFVKSNPFRFGDGVDNGIVEFSIMRYSNGPPKTDHGGGIGYTSGVDVHAGKNWIVRNSRFENFHTPDNAYHLWNPVILMLNGAANTIVENNHFIDVDRAIAFGLYERANDHIGGVIRNNMIFLRKNLNSEYRKAGSDASIILWSSPNTQILHNTIMTNGNMNKSIELRWDSAGAIIRNNIIDAPIFDRGSNFPTISGNVENYEVDMFENHLNANFRLRTPTDNITAVAPFLPNAEFDIDGDVRGGDGQLVDAGADEFCTSDNPCQ